MEGALVFRARTNEYNQIRTVFSQFKRNNILYCPHAFPKGHTFPVCATGTSIHFLTTSKVNKFQPLRWQAVPVVLQRFPVNVIHLHNRGILAGNARQNAAPVSVPGKV